MPLVHSTIYTHETNLRTSAEMLSIKMSYVVVMHNEVKACKPFIFSLVSIVEYDYRVAGYFRRVFIFGYFEEAFLCEINSWVQLFFKNIFPQLIIKCLFALT